MPTDRKRLSVDEAKFRARRQRRLLRRRIRNILLLLLFLACFALGFNRVIDYESGVKRTTFLLNGVLPVPVLEMRPASGETGLVAIVAHGFAGSKELMASFGIELARAGVTAYLFDFPGHGESPVPLANGTFSDQNARDNITAVGEVVAYARTHNSATKRPALVLLGHSMGSTAIGDYAMQHAHDNDILATLLVSPVGMEQPTTTLPRNLLLLVGANDIPFAITNSERMIRLGCGLKETQALPKACGAVDTGTGRRMTILPGANHITILTDDEALRSMLNWIHNTYPQAVNDDRIHSDMRISWLLLALAGALLALFPLSSLLVDVFGINATPRAFKGRDVLLFTLCLLTGITVAVGIQYAWRPFVFVRLLLADYVSGYFFFTALVTLLLIFFVRRVVPVPLPQQLVRQGLLGLLLAAFLYFTVGQLSTFAWQRFTFSSPERLWRCGLLFVLVLPLFLLDEGINRGYQEQGMVRALLTSLSFKALLVLGLLVALTVTPGLDFLSIVLPVLVLIFLLLVAFCTQLYVSGRAAIAAAVLSALVVAWSMSASFPIT